MTKSFTGEYQSNKYLISRFHSGTFYFKKQKASEHLKKI